jgi:hypothetical protein
MNWFKRKPKVDDSSNQNTTTPEPLLLLLIRPFLHQIFSNEVDDKLPLMTGKHLPLGAVVFTSFGFYSGQEITEDMLFPIAILCVGRDGHIGYTLIPRLDMHLWIAKIAEGLSVSIDDKAFLHQRDILLFTSGSYKMFVAFPDAGTAMTFIKDSPIANEQTPQKICYAASWTDDGDRENLRRIEATATYLLRSHEEDKLPHDISEMPTLDSDWQNRVLRPLFDHVELKLKEQVRT